MPPRAAPTLGEGPGEKLVEEADHPAQLPLAALLAVAHGSSAQRWGGTQSHPLSAGKQPPSFSEQMAMPGGSTEPSLPRASLRASAAGSAQRRGHRQRLAARQPPGPAPRRQAASREVLCWDAPVQAGCDPEGPGGLAVMPLPGLRLTKADHKLSEGVGCPGEPPRAVPARRLPPCSKVAGSSVRGMLGTGEPSDASQLSWRGG